MTKHPIRLQKLIAECGLASRREAERWIADGRVTVDGQTAQLGDSADPAQQQIRIDDRILRLGKRPKILVAMNKPRGFVCTNKDPHAEKTIFDLLPNDLQAEKLFCVGRLDKESEGLLLLTNDGELNQMLAHPTYGVEKRYLVRLNKPVAERDFERLQRGITWEEERLKAELVRPVKARTAAEPLQYEVMMLHGRKREIRRLFYALGYDVKRLRRTHIGPLSVRGIPRGRIKRLGDKEISLLRNAALRQS